MNSSVHRVGAAVCFFIFIVSAALLVIRWVLSARGEVPSGYLGPLAPTIVSAVVFGVLTIYFRRDLQDMMRRPTPGAKER